MSYAPSSPEVVRRSPQYGIHIAGGTPCPKIFPSSKSSHFRNTSSSSSSPWNIPTPHNTHTTTRAELHCNNKIAVIPFSVQGGFGALDGTLNVKLRCKKCGLSIVPAQLPEGHIMGWKGEEVTPFAE
jgi:hypothetical protein